MKRDPMKVSVVIPTYNRGTLVRQALCSVLFQTYQKFEIIVVDDGSTDQTSQEIKPLLADRRVRYLKQEHAGVARARNKGIESASGDLISFLDSDDLWKPYKLEYDINFLRNHPKVGAVFGDLEKQNGEEFIYSFMRATARFSKLLSPAPLPGGMIIDARTMYLFLLQEVPIKPTALTIRREALNLAGRFDESFVSGEDWEFLLRLARVTQFGYIDRPLAVLRVSQDSLHREQKERDHLSVLNLLVKEKRCLVRDREALRAVRWGIGNLAKQLGWYYQNRSEPIAAIGALCKGFWQTMDPGFLLRIAAVCVFPPVRGIRNNR